jgi:hypothetical protein
MSDNKELKENKDKRSRGEDDDNSNGAATKFVKSDDENKSAAPSQSSQQSQPHSHTTAEQKVALQARVLR